MYKYILISCLFIQTITGQTKINFNPSDYNLSSASQVALKVYVSNVTNLTAASITVKFNNLDFQYVGVQQGNFLPNLVQFITPPSVAVPNQVKVDQAILGGTSVNGTGLLFTLNLLPLKAGTNRISFINCSLIQPGGSTIPFTIDSVSVIVTAALNAKLFLEGSYNSSSGSMNTTLNSLGFIPLLQPFSGQPWNYNGTESVANNFFTSNPNIADWILVELRSGNNSNTVLIRKACFLLKSGNIIDIDGVSAVRLPVPAGNYYIKIIHRNSIPIISSVKTSIDITSSVYDFTLSNSKAYGVKPMRQISSNVFALWSGDANGDGIINGTDFNLFNPSFINNQTGYKGVDFNLDGYVTGSDFNLFKSNFTSGIRTQVP